MLTREQQQLVVDNFGLAQEWVTKRTVGRRGTRPERLSTATLALCRAAELYEPGSGAFSTFAFHWFFHYQTSEWRAQKLRGFRNPRRQDAEAPGVDRVDTQDFTHPPDPRPSHEAAVDAKDYVEHILAGLPEKWQAVMRMRFLDELSVDEIADRLGMSHQRVSQLVKKAIARIRARFPNPEAA